MSWKKVPCHFRKLLGRGWVTRGLNMNTLALADKTCKVLGPLLVISPEGKPWHFTPFNKICEAGESCAKLETAFDSIRLKLVEQITQDPQSFDNLLEYRIRIDLGNASAQAHFHSTFAKGHSFDCKGYQLDVAHIKQALEGKKAWCKLVPCDANDPILLAKAIITPQVAPLPLEVNTPQGEIEHIVSYQLEKISGQHGVFDRISVAYQVHFVCTEQPWPYFSALYQLSYIP